MMGTWPGDLGKEEARIRLIYKLLYGFAREDIRDLHIPGDIRTAMKRDLEIKGWFRNNWLPLETWSVLENHVKGWAWSSDKVTVWFVRVETGEAMAIPLEHIKVWLQETKQNTVEILTCECGKQFIVPQHSHPHMVKQDIQYSNDETNHKYHSACVFVKPEAFNELTILSTILPQGNRYQYKMLT